MKASIAADLIGSSCLRDGDFLSTGYLNQNSPRLLTFIESASYIPGLENRDIAAVITTPDLAELISGDCAVITANLAKRSFLELHTILLNSTDFYGRNQPNKIHSTAKIADTAVVADTGVVIGAGCIIEAGVIIGRGVSLGRNAIIRSGTVLGGEGFEFKRWDEQLVRVPHAGTVLIEDDVEIQHNTVVDRAVFSSSTTIGHGTKIDNLVQIAHNVTVGSNCLIAAGAVIAGSVIIENDVWVGPGTIISNGIKIGRGAFISLGSTVIRSVPAGARAYGRGLGCTLQFSENSDQDFHQ